MGSREDFPEGKPLKELMAFLEPALANRVVMSQANKLVSSPDVDPAPRSKKEKVVAIVNLVRRFLS